MSERVTLTSMGEKLKNREIDFPVFEEYFTEFKNNLNAIREEFKSTADTTFFNEDAKKINEKHAAFTAVYDSMDRGIRIIENSIESQDLEKFKKGMQLILSATDKLESLRGEIGVYMNSMTRM